jgi:hypothetical protein
MKIVRKIAAFAAMLFALAAGPAAASEDYQGADGGFLVYSAGSIAMPLSFQFPYRRVALASGAPASDWRGQIASRTGGFARLRVSGADYAGRETGRVHVRRLPPGDYEISDFRFAGTSQFSSRRRFSIRFAIRPGGATYIGNFARAPSLGTPLQRTLGAVGFFVISDKSERDNLPTVTVSVTDVSALGHPMLLPREPAE